MVRDEGWEVPNSGVEDDEPADAGPGVMGRLLIAYSHIKEKTHSPRSSSTSSTPRSVEPTQQESEVLALTNSPHSSKESKVEGLKAITHSDDIGRENRVEDVHKEHSATDQEHHEALGDGGEISPAHSSKGSSSFVQLSESPRGSDRSASPTVPAMDLGERIICMLPGSHENPYAVPHSTEPNHTSVPPSPSVHRFLGRLNTERLLTKLADKFHLHEKSPSPRVAAESPSPRVAAESPSPKAAAESPSPRVAAEIPSPKAAAESPSPRAAAKSPGTPAAANTATPTTTTSILSTSPRTPAPTREPPPIPTREPPPTPTREPPPTPTREPPPTPTIATALGPTEN